MLIEREIDITFTLPAGKTFGAGGSNEKKLTGLRVSAQIQIAGSAASVAQLRIYGMTLDSMNRLSTMGIAFATGLLELNKVVIEAGNRGENKAVVFAGEVTMAYIDFQNQPDVAFCVSAQTGIADAVINTAPSSFQGSADVASIMSGFAARMNLSFENSGVDKKIANPYFAGNLTEQARKCAEAAGIEWALVNGTLAIWPKGASRNGSIPVVSPETGMISYPTYTAFGLMLRTLFNPSISFGNTIKIVSSLKPAEGEWTIYSLGHNLESIVPRGQWFSTLEVSRLGGPTPIVAPVTP